MVWKHKQNELAVQRNIIAASQKKKKKKKVPLQ